MTPHQRFAAAIAFTLFAVFPSVQALAQDGARLYAEGIALEKNGNEQAAFAAFLKAAEDGHPPSQRRLGEIYDNGNAAVERDYAEAIRWYQRARDGGEIFPPHKSRLLDLPVGY